MSYHGVVVFKDTFSWFCPFLVEKNQENLGIADVCENFFSEGLPSFNICAHPSTDAMATAETAEKICIMLLLISRNVLMYRENSTTNTTPMWSQSKLRIRDNFSSRSKYFFLVHGTFSEHKKTSNHLFLERYFENLCNNSLRWNGTLKYGDFHEKLNFLKIQDLWSLNTSQKHFEMILPNFPLDECEI